MSVSNIKKEIIALAKEEYACGEQLERVLRARSTSSILEVVTDNIPWTHNHGLLGKILSLFNQKDLRKNNIFLNLEGEQISHVKGALIYNCKDCELRFIDYPSTVCDSSGLKMFFCKASIVNSKNIVAEHSSIDGIEHSDVTLINSKATRSYRSDIEANELSYVSGDYANVIANDRTIVKLGDSLKVNLYDKSIAIMRHHVSCSSVIAHDESTIELPESFKLIPMLEKEGERELSSDNSNAMALIDKAKIIRYEE